MRAETILGQPVRAGRWNTTMTIHPEQARAILECQKQQRPLTQSVVDSYSQRMRARTFLTTHQGIAFDEDGNLLDGQHRMWSCFLTSIPMTVVVFFNEPRANFEHIDVGKNRNGSDFVVLAGLAQTADVGKLVEGALRFLWAYDSGSNPTIAATKPGWGHAERMRTAARHPEAQTFAADVRWKRKLIFPKVPLVALGVLMKEAAPDRAAVFLHQMLTGENISQKDPAFTLREAMIRRSGTRGFRIEAAYKIARAWNAFYEGRSLANVYGSTTPTGETARANGMNLFPRIVGHTPMFARGEG